MRLKNVSKGNSSNTRVVNADTGEQLDGVVSVVWQSHVGDEPRAIIELVRLPVEVITEAEIVGDDNSPPAIAEDTTSTKESTR